MRNDPPILLVIHIQNRDPAKLLLVIHIQKPVRTVGGSRRQESRCANPTGR